MLEVERREGILVEKEFRVSELERKEAEIEEFKLDWAELKQAQQKLGKTLCMHVKSEVVCTEKERNELDDLTNTTEKQSAMLRKSEDTGIRQRDSGVSYKYPFSY